jgi:SAM-dependent methyltransferase
MGEIPGWTESIGLHRPLQNLTPEELAKASTETIGHYQRSAEGFLEGTRDHDVSQNIEALLRHIEGDGPHDILDWGCGPGRDLLAFRELGHQPVGLDGCIAFVEMARQRTGCEVWHQDFLGLELPERAFDGVFANASLFHVPTQELGRVLRDLYSCLKPGGVLFSSNPRGADIERYNGERYGAFLEAETWRNFVLGAGYAELEHYYRPQGRPREQQPWLATVWRRPV